MRTFAYRPEPGEKLVYRALKGLAMNEARELSKAAGDVIEVIEIGVKPNLTKAMLVERCLNGDNWGTGHSKTVARFERGVRLGAEEVVS